MTKQDYQFGDERFMERIIELWHAGKIDVEKLHDALGMSQEEYAAWVECKPHKTAHEAALVYLVPPKEREDYHQRVRSLVTEQNIEHHAFIHTFNGAFKGYQAVCQTCDWGGELRDEETQAEEDLEDHIK